ncbi:fimbrillin family protein [Pedobacter aquatilis]|uniref:fimbrillin family protein n=1 Tax=Pedobacter aquatilis TaxID=351343 RepID=UPI002930D915|nr:fimbrillin family protein [Pedobacter aquatilis]
MKNQNILFATAISLFVLSSSCKKEQNPGTSNPEVNAVKFSSSINGQIKTKAFNDTWETNDAIGVFMKTGTGLTNALASNKNYNTSGDGEFKPATTDQTIYYPADGSAVDFVAYYPYKQANAGNIYTVDVTNQNSQSAIDLLYANNATGLSKTSPNANLVFSHQLSKVEFTVKNGTGVADLNGLTVALAGLNTKANFDLATGTLSGANQVVDIPAKTTAKTGSVLAEAIVVPTADATGKVVTFTLAAGKFKLTLPANSKFEQGKKYTYEVELKNTPANEPVAVALTAVITNWNTVPSGSYTVDQDKDVVTPPTGVEEVVLTETFGTGTIPSTKPKIATYTNYDNKTLTFSDASGNADLRTISSYGDGTNAHVWLPATKESSIKIGGIKLSGYTKFKIKYDLASNITGAANTTDLNVIKVKVNGVDVNVSSKVITGADQNKFFTLEIGDLTPLADNTIEFYGQTATNNYGVRLDNVIITGIK